MVGADVKLKTTTFTNWLASSQLRLIQSKFLTLHVYHYPYKPSQQTLYKITTTIDVTYNGRLVYRLYINHLLVKMIRAFDFLKHIVLFIRLHTVYPKKYAHGFCFAVLCCGYTLTDFPISSRLTSLALWQSNDCPSASKATLMNMDKYFMWIHYERLHNHNKAKHNKTVCIFLGIYCRVPCAQKCLDTHGIWS